MSRLRILTTLSLVAALTTGVLMGQDKKDDKAEPVIISVRLPAYYSKLSLSDKQRKDILKIRGTYAAKIEELNRQMKALKGEERTAMEKVLTTAQKARLKELMPAGAAQEKEKDIDREKAAEFKKPTEEKKK